MENEQIYTMALTRIPGLGLINACNLIRTMGSATAIFQQRKDLASLVPGVTEKLVKALDCPEAFQRAEQELHFAENERFNIISAGMSDDHPIAIEHGSTHIRLGSSIFCE